MTAGPPRVAVDVVHLPRLARLLGEHPSQLISHVLHPDETASDLPLIAESLATKETWIKLAGDRPPSWSFGQASVRPLDDAPDARSAALAAILRSDLALEGARFVRLASAGDACVMVGGVTGGIESGWWITAALR